MTLNKRQSLILDYIRGHKNSSRTEIEEYIASVEDKSSKNTILRDLNLLLKNNFIKKTGSARSIKYSLIKSNELLIKYDVESYFKGDFDKREIKYSQFNFDIYNNLHNLFSLDEIKNLNGINKIYADKIKNFSDTILNLQLLFNKTLFI